MAKVSKRKPTPKKSASHRVSPLKPGLRNARNWATAQMRAASYTRAAAVRMVLASGATIIAILFAGLWLGGVLPDVRQASADFTKSRLVAMGFTVERVDVIGEGRIREDEVRAALGIRAGDYLFDLDMRSAQTRVQSLSWIDDAIVRRLWPDQIVVHIIERQPVALWQRDNVVKVIDASRTVIEDANPSDFASLPLIVGPKAADESRAIYEALRASDTVSPYVDAVIHVGERRWDVVLSGGRARLLLPEKDPVGALRILEEMHATHGVLDLDLEHIDLRQKGRMVVQPSLPGSGI